jgi:hypothetical protein
MDALEAAFEKDLRAWLLAIYERRAGLARMRLEQRILKVLDSERRWLVPLTAGLVVGVGAVPVLGLPAVLGSLILLYVGAIVSGYVTMRRAERIERSVDPRAEALAAAASAWDHRPPFGPDERALLVRIMNLSTPPVVHRASARPLLLDELRGALSHPPLDTWPCLADLNELLLSETPARNERLSSSRS